MNEWTAYECPTVGIVRQQSDGSVQSDQHQTLRQIKALLQVQFSNLSDALSL